MLPLIYVTHIEIVTILHNLSGILLDNVGAFLQASVKNAINY